MLKGILDPLDRKLFPREPPASEYLRRWILPECRTVLDVGCGDEGRLVRTVPGIPFTLGVDDRVPEHAGSPGSHSEYRRLDIRTLAGAFEPASFDAVVALDVIEHLSREDGFRLLEAMETIASTRVIVLTPNGFLVQPPAPDNPHQEHRSGWTTADFRERGYTVVGVNGWRPLRGPYAAIRWRPETLWRRISVLTQPLVVARPHRAFHLLCMKEVASAPDAA